MAMKIEKVVEPVLIGESPHWDDQQHALFFVSILECTIHKYVPATGDHTRTKLCTVSYEGSQDSNVTPKHGSLYRISGTKITKMASNIGISNGLAWDLKEKAFYYTDSSEGNIRRYEYDIETGEISNLTYIFDLKKNNIEGLPDGSTIDTDGNLWIAVFNGSCVLNIDPRTGKLLQKIPIPAKQVTSVTFGGENFDILFVTSASMKIDEEQKPPSGATFMITGLGVRGNPNVNFKL